MGWMGCVCVAVGCGALVDLVDSLIRVCIHSVDGCRKIGQWTRYRRFHGLPPSEHLWARECVLLQDRNVFDDTRHLRLGKTDFADPVRPFPNGGNSVLPLAPDCINRRAPLALTASAVRQQASVDVQVHLLLSLSLSGVSPLILCMLQGDPEVDDVPGKWQTDT